MTLTKVNCSRCDGSGNFSFNLVRGTVCFKCNGAGFTMLDAVKEQKRLDKAAAKKAADKAEDAKRVIAANAKIDVMFTKYKDDNRIGPITKARCARSEPFAIQSYKHLEMVDSGEYKHGCDHLAE